MPRSLIPWSPPRTRCGAWSTRRWSGSSPTSSRCPSSPPAAAHGRRGASPARSREPLPEAGDARSPSCSTCSSTARCRSRFNTAGPGLPRLHPRRRALPLRGRRPDRRRRSTATSASSAAAPALAQLEANVVALVLPRSSAIRRRRAGSSPAAARSPTSTALVTARRERLPEDFLSGILYASDQAHHSRGQGARSSPASRAANVRAVPVDEPLPPAARTPWRSAIAEDRAARPHALPGRGERRHHQHRRRRSARRAGRPRRAGRASGSTWTRPTAASSC